MIEITSWGKSMYGGWYANFWCDGEHTGIHAETRRELIWMLQDYGKIMLDDCCRYDD